MTTTSVRGQIGHLVPAITAAAIVAQQVGSNASRDALFLSHFAVTTLPYFVAAAALLSIPAARLSGRLLLQFGPRRVVPSTFALGGAMFLADWWLLHPYPRAAATLLFFQSSLLGSLAISAYWSLLNERFDPHAAKRLMARVAAGATFGGLLGGIGAERVAALSSAGTLLILLGLLGFACVGGALFVAGGATRPSIPAEAPSTGGGLAEIRRSPLLVNLALLTVLAGMVGTLSDYVLKGAAASYFTRPEDLLRFFGAFYAATGVAAFVLQITTGRVLLARLGLGGSVSVHPAAVAAGGLFAFAVPAPWFGVFPRGFDLTVRNSTYRAAYELLYAPLSETAKRRSKPFIDVGCDAVGKGLGALVALPLAAVGGAAAILLVNAAAMIVAAAELVIARRIQPAHVNALEDGLRRQAPGVEHSAQLALADFTMAQTMIGMDREAIRTALQQQAPAPVREDQAGWGSTPVPPILLKLAVIQTADSSRIRQALRDLPTEPLIVAALIPLLGRQDLVKPVVEALTAQTARAAGQVVDALLADDTPEIVRRRLPMVLMSWNSTRALDGLMAGLKDRSPAVRLRCSQALLSATAKHPTLGIPAPDVFAATQAVLDREDTDARLRMQVFNLLSLVLDRQAVSIARHAFEGSDDYLRGTALEYLESVLPPPLAVRLMPRLSPASAPVASPRAAGAAQAALIRAGETITVSRDELLKRLAEAGDADAGELQ